MADDGITVDNGSNTDYVPATDDVAGVHYQKVKIVDGTADSTTVAAVGGGVEANALRVTIANDSTGTLSVDDGGSTISIDDGSSSITVDNAQLSVVGGGTEAAAMRVTIASDSTGVLSVDDNGSTLSVDDGGSTLSIDDGGGNISIDDGGNSITVDGTVTSNVGPATSGGLTTYHLVSDATTNATVVKASAGQLYGYYIYNSNAAARKLAFHNSASSPTAGASIFFAIPIPASSAANVEFTNGIAFSSGIAITTVTELTDAGNTAVAANDLIINLFYK